MKQDEKARKRAEVIVKVRSGLITATAAARELGISRKTYYEWDRKGLAGMVTALTDTPAGRPSAPNDSEKEELKRQLEETKRELELFRARMRIQEIMADNPVPRKGAGSGARLDGGSAASDRNAAGATRTKKKRSRTVDRNEKREREGDSGGDQGMQGEDEDDVSRGMHGDSAPVFKCDAMACEDGRQPGAGEDTGSEESGAA